MPRPRKNPLPDAPEINATVAPVEVAEAAPATPVEDPFTRFIEKASESQKEKLRKALGVQAVVKPPVVKQTNADVRQILAANGGGTFHKPGFQPCPPQGVADKGEAAIAAWLERWNAGQTFSSRQAEHMDAEELAAIAVE